MIAQVRPRGARGAPGVALGARGLEEFPEPRRQPGRRISIPVIAEVPLFPAAVFYKGQSENGAVAIESAASLLKKPIRVFHTTLGGNRM